LVAVDAEKLTMTSRRPSHEKSRRETQSTAAFFKPSTASSRATAAAILDETASESPKNAFYYAPALTSMKLEFAL
jgi:hypothetical protein